MKTYFAAALFPEKSLAPPSGNSACGKKHCLIISNIIKRSQISADTQLCRNLNTVLANAQAEGRIPGSVYDVLYLENEAGYILENLNPTSEGFYFAWDEKTNRIVYIQDDLLTVYYPADTTINPGDCWITVGSAEEAAIVAAKGYNLALECDITDEIVLSNVVSINTLGFKCGNVTMNSGASDVEVARLIGNFGSTSISAGATNIVTSGAISSLNVTGTSNTSVNIGGYVNSYSAGSGVNSAVNSTGLVSTVATGNSSVITNNGVVVNKGSSTVNGGSNTTVNNTVSVGNKEDLDSVRTQVAMGVRTFEGETVKLSSDINLNGISFTPISNFYRGESNESYFRGTFDGQGHTIQNFSNTGFSVAGLNAGKNDTSVYFGETAVRYNEAVYGLFACTFNATIKNVNVVCQIDMIIDNANGYVGDSVGGIVGFAGGDYLIMENCTVSGYVNGYDGVGGLVGRAYARNLTFKNCTNNATVTAVAKAAGICGFFNPKRDYTKSDGYYKAGTLTEEDIAKGYGSDVSLTFIDCVNNGNVYSLGNPKQIELVAWNVNDNQPTTKVTEGASNKYAAAGIMYQTIGFTQFAEDHNIVGANGASKAGGLTDITGFINNGEVFYGTSQQNIDANGKYFEGFGC